MTRLEIWSLSDIPEIVEGQDLVPLIVSAAELVEGDIVVVTSKIISKTEGRVRFGDRDTALAAETERVVARRDSTVIVRNRLGLTMAAAGIDASNVPRGSIVVLPEDPDASAALLRADLHARTGRNVAVLITDTAGRAWREGQTDIAIGAAGLLPTEDFAGREDPYGNPLQVTLPAVADEIAAAAELAGGKLARRPIAVLRGRADLVLPVGQDGPGARSLIRPDGSDLFGYGAREAVVRALAADPATQQPFGAAAPLAELITALAQVPLAPAAVSAVCFAHGWSLGEWSDDAKHAVAYISPRTP